MHEGTARNARVEGPGLRVDTNIPEKNGHSPVVKLAIVLCSSVQQNGGQNTIHYHILTLHTVHLGTLSYNSARRHSEPAMRCHPNAGCAASHFADMPGLPDMPPNAGPPLKASTMPRASLVGEVWTYTLRPRERGVDSRSQSGYVYNHAYYNTDIQQAQVTLHS